MKAALVVVLVAFALVFVVGVWIDSWPVACLGSGFAVVLAYAVGFTQNEEALINTKAALVRAESTILNQSSELKDVNFKLADANSRLRLATRDRSNGRDQERETEVAKNSTKLEETEEKVGKTGKARQPRGAGGRFQSRKG